MAVRPAPRPPAPKPPAPKPDPNPPPMPVPRPPAPQPVPIPVPVPPPRPNPVPAPRPNPVPTRPLPPIIVVPGPGGQPVQSCNPDSTTSVYNSCPTGIAQPSETAPGEKSNTGAVIGGVIGGLFALVALIVAGFFLARWRRHRREMNDVEAFSYQPRSMSDKTVNDPEGVRAASVGAGAGAAGVAASTTSTTAAGGVGESEQTQTRSFVALPPPPASPTTTIGFLDDPFRSSSQVKVHLDDEKNGGLTSGSSSTRPGTPAGPESLLLPPPAHQHQR